MTLTLNLTKQEEEQFQAVAAEKGLRAEECVLQAVKALLPAAGTQDKLTALRSLLEDDEEEQRETGEYLLRALDEDRLSSRPLYP